MAKIDNVRRKKTAKAVGIAFLGGFAIATAVFSTRVYKEYAQDVLENHLEYVKKLENDNIHVSDINGIGKSELFEEHGTWELNCLVINELVLLSHLGYHIVIGDTKAGDELYHKKQNQQKHIDNFKILPDDVQYIVKKQLSLELKKTIESPKVFDTEIEKYTFESHKLFKSIMKSPLSIATGSGPDPSATCKELENGKYFNVFSYIDLESSQVPDSLEIVLKKKVSLDPDSDSVQAYYFTTLKIKDSEASNIPLASYHLAKLKKQIIDKEVSGQMMCSLQ